MKTIVNTHDFNAVAGGGGDVPGALLPAGVLVRPVGAAEGSAGAVDLVLTLSWREREEKRTINIKIKLFTVNLTYICHFRTFNPDENPIQVKTTLQFVKCIWPNGNLNCVLVDM